MTNEKKFNVQLDGKQCKSYTVKGVKYTANRVHVLPESKAMDLKAQGVFLVWPYNSNKGNELPKPRVRKSGHETNPDDKGIDLNESPSKQAPSKPTKPSGVITKGDLNK